MAGGKIYLRLPNMIGQHVATKSLKIDGSLQSSCRQVLRLANSPLESREISFHLVFEEMEFHSICFLSLWRSRSN